jgi:NAD(P)-dependent dehydrogenase (short-subunit alcohol dehydrogenase family)
MTKVKQDRFIRRMGPLGESVMTVLVSNANGKIGQEVAKALLQAGHKTRIGARHVDKA